MLAGSLARRYARALMSLAVDGKQVDKVGGNLRDLAGAYRTSPELADVLANPSYPRAQRRKVLDAVLTKLKAVDLVKTFCYLLLDKERMAAVPDIAREVEVMIEARAGRVQADVTSAVPLTAGQLKKITAALEKLSGKKVVVAKHEDPELLGGVVAKVGDVVYDGSLRTQLHNLRDRLAR